jgi:hypothetical protein
MWKAYMLKEGAHPVEGVQECVRIMNDLLYLLIEPARFYTLTPVGLPKHRSHVTID